nr:hypothetical protein [Priestia endophytica]
MGNITVIAGLIIDFEEEVQQRLIIDGNLIQALDGVTALGNELEEASNKNEIWNIIGYLLQPIDNSLQALSGAYELKSNSYNEDEKGNQEENGESFDVIGSWKLNIYGIPLK